MLVPSFNGWNPYQLFLAILRLVNPPAARTVQTNEPITFHIQGTAPFNNTPAHASSSFIRNIRYNPHGSIAYVRLGTRDYWYPMTMRRLSNWLNYNSLGRYYNKYVKLK